MRANICLACLLFCSVVTAGERVPLFKKFFGSGTLSEKLFQETVLKLNGFEQYNFQSAYRNDNTTAMYSDKKRTACWLKRHDTDELADLIAQEIAEYKYPVFRYANWVGYCTVGDTEELAQKVKYILIGAGEWRE